MAKFSKLERTLIGLAALSLLLSLGILIFYYFVGTVEHQLINMIKRDREYYYNSAIYLISSADTFCRPCAKYDQLKNNPDLRIIFLVEPDFSDIDIENFRRALQIEMKDEVRRMDNEWRRLYLKLNRNKWHFYYNFLIIINRGRIEEIRRF